MVDQVFTAEAMAICAERGHTLRTVRTWHSVEHLECSRCGETPPFGGSPVVCKVGNAQNAHFAHGAAVARPSRVMAEPRPPRDADATPRAPKAKRASPTGRSWGATAEQRRVRDEDIARRVAAGEERKAIAESHDIHPSRIAQILHALRQTKPAPIDHTARDAEIRRRRAANESAEAVAAAFGMSVARVYQIAPRQLQGSN
jgi:uncharacterized protein (DUF433 family)